MKSVNLALTLGALLTLSNSAFAASVTVIWGDNGESTKGYAEPLGDAISDGYVNEFTPFYADELVGIEGDGYFDRLSYDGLIPGDLTYSLSLELDGVWTTIWSATSPAGTGEEYYSLSETQIASCWYCQTPKDAGFTSTSGVSFEHGLVTGIRLTVDADFTWAFHNVVGDSFIFNDNTLTEVPLPAAAWLFLSGLISLTGGRKLLA